MGARSFLVFSLLLAACGDDNGTGPTPPGNLTGELAFIADGAIVIRSLADGGMRRIDLNTGGLGGVEGLAWQPDGRALVYAPFNLDRSRYELHRVPLDGSLTTVLYPSEGHQAYPAFALDGRLAYWVNGVDLAGEQHGYEIFVDGQPLSRPSVYCLAGRAAWSPDGSVMVIAGRSEGVDRLVRKTVATGAEAVLLQAAGDQSVEQLVNPTYSRSGDHIAFTRVIFGPNLTETDEIWVVNADGSNPQRLTSGHHDWLPAWSPDDAWIAFERNEPPRAFIAIVSATGGSIARLAEEGIAPAWR